MSQLAGSPHTCYRCKALPEVCACVGCECGVCKSYRIPTVDRDKLTANDKALETSAEDASKLADAAKISDAANAQAVQGLQVREAEELAQRTKGARDKEKADASD